mmetsp:Transcript_18133/g.59226  ORF Transcript_18133/g.59226 Transcript_18133/m.59226 type:complete len:207 (-) Transcript_18133:1222-1842(-)
MRSGGHGSNGERAGAAASPELGRRDGHDEAAHGARPGEVELVAQKHQELCEHEHHPRALEARVPQLREAADAPREHPPQNSGNQVERTVAHLPRERAAVAERQTRSDGEAANREHVVEGGGGHDERRNPLVHSVPLALQLEHPQHHDRRRDGTQDEAESDSERRRHAENQHGSPANHNRLRNPRHCRQPHRHEPDAAESLEVELEA